MFLNVCLHSRLLAGYLLDYVNTAPDDFRPVQCGHHERLNLCLIRLIRQLRLNRAKMLKSSLRTVKLFSPLPSLLTARKVAQWETQLCAAFVFAAECLQSISPKNYRDRALTVTIRHLGFKINKCAWGDGLSLERSSHPFPHRYKPWGLFLESPGSFSGRESCFVFAVLTFKIKVLTILTMI